jgi:hypothetical protein
MAFWLALLWSRFSSSFVVVVIVVVFFVSREATARLCDDMKPNRRRSPCELSLSLFASSSSSLSPLRRPIKVNFKKGH